MPGEVVVQLFQMVGNDGVKRGLFWLVACVASGWKRQGVKVRGHAVMIATRRCA